MRFVITVKVIVFGILMIFLCLAEFVLWIWFKMFGQLVKRPQIITFGLTPKGATFVIRKTAQGICSILTFGRKWLLIKSRHWLWGHFRSDLIQYYPSIYRKGQQIYSFLQQIRNFFTGP